MNGDVIGVRREGPKFKDCTAARQYVYSVLASMIEAEINDQYDGAEGWMFGGIDNEFDRRRLDKELKKTKAKMLKRAEELQR